MPIPDPQTLLLPVLKVLADGAEHQVEEIRDRMKIQFAGGRRWGPPVGTDGKFPFFRKYEKLLCPRD